ncbi:MAG: PspC domain-containing protein [Kineosporiaceae bacterium]|nr:PspC domain-containing protein [Kineosporiaceae bacterium]
MSQPLSTPPPVPPIGAAGLQPVLSPGLQPVLSPGLQPGLPAGLPTVIRPPLVRLAEGRVVAGVAAGVARHLSLPVGAVRIAFVVAALGGGAGLVLYIWLWALVPSWEQPPPTPAATGVASSIAAGGSAGTLPGPHGVASPAGVPGRVPPAPVSTAHPVPVPAPGRRSSTRIGDLVVGGMLLAGGLTVLGSQIGWQVSLGATLPLFVVLGGAALVYTQLDEVQGTRWALSGPSGRGAALRVGLGLLLVLGGVLLAVIGSTDVAYAGRVLAAVAAMLGGVLLVLAPWGIRFWRDLGLERDARARESERADIAAHLHDSVLQTLALIQRSSDDPAMVTRLARTQERELRSWLYGGRTRTADGADRKASRLHERVDEVAEDVEDLHGVAIDVVVVGDRDLDERGEALIAALREAMVNAVRHAGAPVMVYVEALPDAVEAFVRDRGPGFEVGEVPADRHGVRESIIGRMRRYGGTAAVRSVRGEGTEVRLSMPDATGESREDRGDGRGDGRQDGTQEREVVR